jgi:molybdenum cofactor biosynthesis protein B
MSQSTQDHQQRAAETVKAIPYAIITASDSRTPETDTSGHYLQQVMAEAGHTLVGYQVVKDDPNLIGALLEAYAPQVRILLINGGTGIGPRDNTFDAVYSRLEKILPGFGELFRMLSYAEIGSAAMLSRAVAGVYGGCVVVSMPGSPHAVRLAMEKLILPELTHLAWEVAGRV